MKRSPAEWRGIIAARRTAGKQRTLRSFEMQRSQVAIESGARRAAEVAKKK